MKITRKQLRRIIKESESYKNMLSKNHVFGEPWSGTPHDLAVVQGKTFGGGSVLDLKGYDKMVDAGIAFTKGNAKSIIPETKIREIIREVLLSEDKSGKGACPDSGCIKKGDGGWKIISNKTGKEWPQTYTTKEKAENALKAYHARG